jgi:DNA-binding response OmpR family regulator
MVILIVEDEVLIGLDLHMLLSCAGYRVQGPATSAKSALAIAAMEKPDVAFVDVNLAGNAEGLELARAARPARHHHHFLHGSAGTGARGAGHRARRDRQAL